MTTFLASNLYTVQYTPGPNLYIGSYTGEPYICSRPENLLTPMILWLVYLQNLPQTNTTEKKDVTIRPPVLTQFK